MDIYEIKSDYDVFKFFVFKQGSSSNYLNFEGQKLGDNWIPLEFEIFKEKGKKKDKRFEDFDASCYFDGILIVNNNLKEILEANYSEKVEILPVNTDRGPYYYINVTNKIKSIKNVDKMSSDEIMEMVRNNRYVFDLQTVKNESIFRDSKMSSSYFVTDFFINLMNNNQIKGLRYEKVGHTE
ncbi:hypothetical protein M5J14_22480 [Lysinibacillus sp. OL1_EC]|uniref:imm11 family protein n=1 Tax=unclassified Lysinibacillus TaxID=2636778 RepID=UPI00103CCD3E|nr:MULTISPECIES: DUF1629 domain-containing protein [unclassified Lysinibacillus]MCM0627269.1 hypothetical protein [Lysinibacillus sp. OL1_EC]TBV88579.1 hypothetical protein EW028_09155 [Lysinibacillus sp. OL1]UKJ43923.1 hypothetical protein L6W14_14220 [Lysinibacillus sp. ACHW1.5]WGT37891.1 hypothetical protein QH639_18975 [Lysinibacillus sp. 1 U-2021]